MTDFKPLTNDKVKFIVIHCSATRPSQHVGVKEIRQWHLQRGFFDIGYHHVINRDGFVENGRPRNQPGAHVTGYNGKSIGICMVGGVTEKNVNVAEDNFTKAQWDTLRMFLPELKRQYPGAKIVGHRDIAKGKACPSFDVQEKLEQWGLA